MLVLLDAIKTIIYKFEDQKYLPLSLHHAKRNFYAFRQGNLPNPDYLHRSMNLVYMGESYDAKLYHQAMFKISQDSTVYSTTAEADLQDDKIKMIETIAREIYLACAFVINSNLRRYGRLVEDLENDYTKDNDNYPRNMVKAYQLLNEYKQWNPRATLSSHRESHFRNREIITNLHSEQQNGRKSNLPQLWTKRKHQARMSGSDDRKR